MTTESLKFELEELEGEPLAGPIFIIVCHAAQADSRLSAEAAIDQIIALLSAGKRGLYEIGLFLRICYHIAEQIPYHHPSVVKLVLLVEQGLDSLLMVGGPKNDHIDHERCYHHFGVTLYDYHSTEFPDDNPAAYVNFQNFIAHVYGRRLLRGCTLATYVLQDAFEDQKKKSPEGWKDPSGTTPEGRDACVNAALRYLLLLHDQIYEQVMKDDA